MTEITKHKRKRTIARKSVYNLIDKAGECMINFETLKNSFEALSSYRCTLVEKFSQIQTLDNIITDLLYDDDKDDEVELDEIESGEFTQNYRKNLMLIDKFLETTDKKVIDLQQTITKSKTNFVKLPALELHPFNGNPEHWQTFFENFSCAIDGNKDLSPIQKFTYLRNLLQGPALTIITGLKLTNENYLIALDMLKERYNNSQSLISSHMQSLLEIEPVRYIDNVSGLRKLYDYIQIQIRSLENLGIEPNKYGPMLIPVLMSKIPVELKVIINKEFINDQIWDIKKALKILQIEIKARENTHKEAEYDIQNKYHVTGENIS